MVRLAQNARPALERIRLGRRGRPIIRQHGDFPEPTERAASVKFPRERSRVLPTGQLQFGRRRRAQTRRAGSKRCAEWREPGQRDKRRIEPRDPLMVEELADKDLHHES